MSDLITKEILKHNVDVLQNIKLGEKLYVDADTLKLTVDNRHLQGLRRSENRHECLLPILLTLKEYPNPEILDTLTQTYKEDFKQLEHVKTIINGNHDDKKTIIKNKVLSANLEEEISQKDAQIKDLNGLIKNLEKKITSLEHIKIERNNLSRQVKELIKSNNSKTIDFNAKSKPYRRNGEFNNLVI